MLRRRSRLVVALATAVMAVAAVAGVLVHQPSTADAGANVPIGVYRGPGPWGAQRIPAYEQFLGRPVDMVLDYMDVDTWANQTWPDWQADAWQGSGKQLVLGDVGIFIQGGSWAQAASGAYDQYWKTLGQRLVAKGQANAILRGAHEFNGDWFHYQVRPSEVQDFITAWRRWVDIMRSVPGQQFTFEFNPVIGQSQLPNPEIAYPGDQWVDHVAIDFYDDWYNQGFSPGGTQPTQAQRDAVWLEILNGPRGLIFWRDFAAQHHKQMSFPEWGVETWPYSGDGLIHGGGDNASFIQRAYDTITDPSFNVAYHAPWEYPGDGLSDPDSQRNLPVPNARAAFLNLFGGPASGGPRTTVPSSSSTTTPSTTATTAAPPTTDTSATSATPPTTAAPPTTATTTATSGATSSTTATTTATTPTQAGGVTAAAFGATAPGGAVARPWMGFKFGSLATLDNAGTASTFRLWASGGTKAQDFVPVIYATDGSGNPTQLVAQGAQVTIAANQAAGWVSSALPPTPLAAGTYLLGLISGSSSQSAQIGYTPVNNAGYYTGNAWPTASATWGNGYREGMQWSFAVDLAGAGANPANPATTTTAATTSTTAATTSSTAATSAPTTATTTSTTAAPATTAPTATTAAPAVATLGNTTPGSATAAPYSGYKFGTVFTLNGSLSATTFQFHVKGGSKAQSFRPVVYATDSAGNPTTLLAQGATVTIKARQAAGWVSVAIPRTDLAPGTYLLGLVSGAASNGARVSYQSVARAGLYNPNAWSAPSSTWGRILREPRSWSMYLG